MSADLRSKLPKFWHLVPLFLLIAIEVLGFVDGAAGERDRVLVCHIDRPVRPVDWLIRDPVQILAWPACRSGLWFSGDGSPTSDLREAQK
jgi:hypothetical protein